MNAFVTGGTGFVGSHLVRALVARGARVRCLVRPDSRVDNLEGLDVETVTGDLRRRESFEAALEGVEWLFHCAADYRLWVPDPAAMYAANVDGTRNVLAAAGAARVRRVVYTSTVGALGLPADGSPGDETTAVDGARLVGHYKRSKYLAEQVALELARGGLPVVLVHPTAPVGERDIKPTATGRMILDFLQGRMAAYVDTGLNLVDVRDVALGHLLAAEKGRLGEKYILGHENLTLKQIFDRLAAISGRPAPRLKLPHWVPLAVSAVDTAVARLGGRRPRFELDAVRLSRKRMFFDAGKAVRELGLPQSPVRGALERAVHWFRERGLVEAAA
jgi:dihydroflavonol-4-reductase